MALGDGYKMLTNLRDLRDQRKALRMQEQMAQSEIDKNNAAIMGAMNGGDDPAVVKIADEIQKARAAGDIQRVNDLVGLSKMYDRGFGQDLEGNPVLPQTYATQMADFKALQSGMGQRAKNQQDLLYSPQIEYETNKAKTAAEISNQLPEARQQLNQSVSVIDDLLKSGDYKSVVGLANPLKGNFLGFKTQGSDAAVAQENINSLNALSTLAKTGQLKGVLSDADIALLSQGSFGIKGGLSNKEAENRLNKLKSTLQNSYQNKLMQVNQFQGQRPQMAGVVSELNALTNNNPMATPPRNPNLNPDMPLGPQVNPQQPTESVIDWRDYRRANNKNAKR